MEKLQIKELRKEAGYSQSELAKAMNVCSVTVCQWENGDKTPMASRLPRLAAVLHCTIDELYTGRQAASTSR